MTVTLLPKDVATVGYEFTFVGGSDVCNQCPLKKVCVESLKRDHTYIVTNIRKKEHQCLIDGTMMIVCDVEETSYIITIEKKKFLEGMIVTRKPLICDEFLCKFFENCKNPLFDNEVKVKVIKKLEEIECPLNYNLILVKVKISNE